MTFGWHAFFGLPGSCNDLNVLSRSPLFYRLINGEALACNYVVNGSEYDMGYYLADGIYPTWATFVKAIHRPLTQMRAHFAQCQESARKYMERAFCVIQKRFGIIRGPAEYWKPQVLWQIMTWCIIFHNMITKYA